MPSLRDSFRLPISTRHFCAGLSHAAPSGLDSHRQPLDLCYSPKLEFTLLHIHLAAAEADAFGFEAKALFDGGVAA